MVFYIFARMSKIAKARYWTIVGIGAQSLRMLKHINHIAMIAVVYETAALLWRQDLHLLFNPRL